MPSPAIEDFGVLSGPLLVFGGPYSNLQATEAVLAEAGARGIPATNRICTGDAVAYCADPAAVIERLDGECHWIAGNVERQLAGDAEDCGCGFQDGSACDLLSGQWYPHARAHVDGAQRARLGDCSDIGLFTWQGRRVAVLHGGASDVARYLWPDSPVADFADEIAALARIAGPVDMVLAGHCGIAFQRQVGDCLWINAGAIGLPPHDGRTMTRFAIVTQRGVTIERLTYDHQSAARRMREERLPEGYAAALETGIWPSEDILPASLRR